MTVAIIAGSTTTPVFDESDVEIETYRGGGPGGQHRNTSDTGVKATHLPTGITAKVDRGRSWWQNRQDALTELQRRVTQAHQDRLAEHTNTERVTQIGTGDRAGHDWTWCGWRDEVVHHPTRRRYKMSAALKGRFL